MRRVRFFFSLGGEEGFFSLVYGSFYLFFSFGFCSYIDF